MLVRILKVISALGVVLTIIGCVGLLLGVAGVFDLDNFQFGLSAGIRVIGSVAISGCLLSAIGYGAREFINQ